jgi:hemolysin activation/secretion protein
MGEDNQGSFLSGRWRTSAYVRGSNATGQGDSIYLSSQFSTDAFGESLIYNIPIGTYGTTAGLDVTYYKMRLGKQYKANEIRGTSSIYTPRISWELALQESFNARLNLGMDIEVIKKTTNGTKTTDDQLVVPYFGFNLSKNDSYGQTTFGPRFNFSVADFLGASSYNHPSASRPSTGGFFFKYEHSASRLQRMPWESYLSIRSQFQVASHTLPSSEQLQLGGAYTIRGYPEGDYLCDMGGDVNFDWVMPMYLIPKDWKLPKSDMPLRNQVEWVIFSDVGGGDIRKVASGENKHKFLAGVGGGLRLRLVKGSFLGLQWAKALGEKPVGGLGPSTFYFTFQLEK